MSTKIFITSIIFATMTITSVAQTVTDHIYFDSDGGTALSTPKEFSYNNIPNLIMYDSYDINTLTIYNDNLEIVKKITMKEEIPFTYKQTFVDEVRDFIEVKETKKEENGHFESYQAFLHSYEKVFPTFSESHLIITDLGDGKRKIIVDCSMFDPSDDYFDYDTFGKKYPKRYYIDNGNTIQGYRITYENQYTEWKPIGTRVENCTKSQKRMRLYNINLNQGDCKANGYFEVSQTLFNDDASFEYITPKYKLSTKGMLLVDNYSNRYPEESDENIITTRSKNISEQKEIVLAGFQVISEDGTIISDITFDSEFEGRINLGRAFVISIGNNTYLAFDGYYNDTSSTIFYKIEKNNANAIQKVKIAPSTMTISPTIAKGSSTMNVTFDDENEKGSDIIVVSANGAAIKKYHVPAGQTSTQIQTNTSAGVYCVSRIQKGNVAETKKIMIK